MSPRMELSRIITPAHIAHWGTFRNRRSLSETPTRLPLRGSLGARRGQSPVNGWWPKINSQGDVVSGAGDIWVRFKNGDTRRIDRGTLPQWIDNHRIVYNGLDFTRIRNVVTNQVEHDLASPYSWYAAGGGRWFGLFQAGDIPLRLFEGSNQIREWLNHGMPSIS